MQEYDDAGQVYYLKYSLTNSDKRLIATLDKLKEVWQALDKRYKHSDIGANSLFEAFSDYKVPPESSHGQFKIQR